MIIENHKLRAKFLARIRTQERAYNDLNIYYTPRLFTKLVKDNEELKQKLNLIYAKLIDKIKLPVVKGAPLFFSDMHSLHIENYKVFAKTINSEKKIPLNDFSIISEHIKHITIDHDTPFYDLIKHKSKQLNELKNLTTLIKRNNYLNKESMRTEYDRIVNSYKISNIENLLYEIHLIARDTQLTLMPSDKNYSKGKRLIPHFG